MTRTHASSEPPNRQSEVTGIACAATCFPVGYFAHSLFPQSLLPTVLTIVALTVAAGAIASWFSPRNDPRLAVRSGLRACLVAAGLGGGLTVTAIAIQDYFIRGNMPQIDLFMAGTIFPLWAGAPDFALLSLLPALSFGTAATLAVTVARNPSLLSSGAKFSSRRTRINPVTAAVIAIALICYFLPGVFVLMHRAAEADLAKKAVAQRASEIPPETKIQKSVPVSQNTELPFEITQKEVDSIVAFVNELNVAREHNDADRWADAFADRVLYSGEEIDREQVRRGVREFQADQWSYRFSVPSNIAVKGIGLGLYHATYDLEFLCERRDGQWKSGQSRIELQIEETLYGPKIRFYEATPVKVEKGTR